MPSARLPVIYCLLIGCWLPLMQLCPAIMDMGPGRPKAQQIQITSMWHSCWLCEYAFLMLYVPSEIPCLRWRDEIHHYMYLSAFNYSLDVRKWISYTYIHIYIYIFDPSQVLGVGAWSGGAGGVRTQYRTCPFWHPTDLEVIPTPKILSLINSSNMKSNYFERKPKTHRFVCVLPCCFTWLPKTKNDRTADKHILV